MNKCPKCGSRHILADRSCKPCGWRPLGPVPGSVTFRQDEVELIEVLAGLVKTSRQNVGLRMQNAAETVLLILENKKSLNDPIQARAAKTSTNTTT